MSESAELAKRVVPAQLSFLAIYNPSLGNTDETVGKQIVYYWSREKREGGSGQVHRHEKQPRPPEEQENERLRQVGLAQGMIDFAKNFSNGAPVDSIETEKSRIVLHELEPKWWILASIDLTRLPTAKAPASSTESSRPLIEYSSREVSPAALVAKQLAQAHSIFLLHHASSLQTLLMRVGRDPFCSLLERYWNLFTRDWDVLLHGNPAVDIYNGVKLACGGELGVGVGEEQWGSGEREVLEDFTARTDGLVDLVVSRFGDAPSEVSHAEQSTRGQNTTAPPEPWLGTELDPRSSDGVIFSGVGAVSRRSLATVSQWIEAIFKNGELAYGVGENPSSRVRRKKRRTSPKPANGDVESVQEVHPQLKPSHVRAPDLRRKAMENNAAPPGIPPPLVTAVERSLDQAIAKAGSRETSRSPRKEKSEGEALGDSSMFGTENMMKYLKLGYGSAWTLNPAGLGESQTERADSSRASQEHTQTAGVPSISQPQETSASDNPTGDEPLNQVDPTPEISDDEEAPFTQRLEQSVGKFIIGLFGDLENTEFAEDKDDATVDARRAGAVQRPQRVLLRTITVELANPHAQAGSRSPSLGSVGSTSKDPPTSAGNSVDGARAITPHQKVQVAVYVHQPFIFVFLFELHTPSLNMPTFYRNIHHQLGPLQKPLLKSTDPSKVAERIAEAMGERANTTSPVKNGTTGPPIYDVTYDPAKLTVRTSIPNIPIPGSLAAEGLSSRSSSLTVSGSWYTLGIPISSSSSTSRQPHVNLIRTEWSRLDALNVHSQILNTWTTTRTGVELERTVKTGRGWWVLWMQIPSTGGQRKEAFLVRKATDHKGGSGKSRESSSGRWLLREQAREASGSSSRSGASATTTAGVTEGVGVDARKWVEGLLHFV